MKRYLIPGILPLLTFLILTLTLQSCSKKDDGPLAPYEGGTSLSNILVESGSFRPEVTWLGGYVTIFGINRGNHAALDTSLVWLVYAPSNSIHFPVKYGVLPQGAQDLTGNYGGKTLDSLSEDNPYTFWVLKEEAWNQISASAKGKNLLVDSILSNTIKLTGDSIKVSQLSLSTKSQNIDVFVNIKNQSQFGPLADITILPPANSPAVKVIWTIKQTGIKDTLIAAIGITEGIQYTPSSKYWEVYSADTLNGKEVYGKSNVIPPGVAIGQKVDKTKIFFEFPASGLTRNKDYYLWIANKSWDAERRTRSTPYYSYVTFRVY